MAKLRRPLFPVPSPDGGTPRAGRALSADATAARGAVGTAQDPRWALAGRSRLSPALHFLLMVGRPAECRLPGWVEVAQVPLGDLDRHVDAAWTAWGEVLTAEAAAHDFVPYATTHTRPRGAGVDRWKRAFLAAHRY